LHRKPFLKWGHRTKKLKKPCPTRLARISIVNLWHFGHKFGTGNVRKSITPSKGVLKPSLKKDVSQKWFFVHPGPDDVILM